MHKCEHAYVFVHTLILGSSTQGLMHGTKARYSYILSPRPYIFLLPHLYGSLKPLSQSDNFSQAQGTFMLAFHVMVLAMT